MTITRPLTAGEISIAQSVFGNSINYDAVRVHSGRLFGSMHKENFAKTTLSQIFMHNLYHDDFSKAHLGMQELFIHEMAHVWQYQQKAYNPRLIDLRNALKYTQDAYQYALSDKKDLIEYGTEQQASIIARYFLLQRQNNPADKKEIALFKKVLGNFLKDPTYAKNAMFAQLLKKIAPPQP